MPGLKDQLKSVSPESLAGLGSENDPQDEIVDEEVETEETEEVETEETETEEEESEGRTIDNVYGELTRKQEKAEEMQQKFNQSMLSQMGNLVENVTERLAAQPAGQQGPKTVEDYSVAELTAHRDSLPAEDPNRTQLDSVIADKIVNEKVRAQVQEITGMDRMQAQREAAALEAVERYPELADETSQFYRKVDQRIRSLDSAYVNANPRVAMDVANEVAIAQGVSPTQPRTRMVVPGKPNATRRDGGAPVPKAESKLKMSEAEAMKIAKSLEGALGRKFTKKEILEIRENHKSYDDNRGLFTR